jgi:aryl-alcohol dehydrogenase-like predicted oxidoreductase
MEIRPLGRTGIPVSTFCLGTMMFGAWGDTDQSDCTKMVDLALDAGVNFIDTADVYDFGVSEEMLGTALKGRRDSVVLATKFNNAVDDDVNHRGNSRRWIVQAVENSLRRLGTDRIDVYFAHRPDPHTDIDETLGALSDLVHQGKVLAIGSSTFPAELIVEAQWTADRRGHERFSVEQPPYSIFVRGIERAVLPTAQRHNLGVMVWAPLNGGWLTGKYLHGDAPEGSRAARQPDHFDFESEWRTRKLDALEQLSVLAAEIEVPLAHLAHAFVLAHPAVTSAILGPRTADQLSDVLAGAEVRLSAEALDRIDAIVPPGVDINPADRQYDPPPIVDPALRRRRTAS